MKSVRKQNVLILQISCFPEKLKLFLKQNKRSIFWK